jgi:hypothetical protein
MSSIEDLINQMKPKRDLDELFHDKKSSTDVSGKNSKSTKSSKKSEGKHKSTIKETTFDYYKILGVEPTATQLEIKRAYQSKLKKNHLDKVPATKENIAKYKLLCEAGDLLSDPLERKAYDMQKKLDMSSKGFESQKDSFNEFLKLQEQNMTEENKSIAKLNFERGLADLDRKHGYDRNQSDDKMSKDETKRRTDDLMMLREQELLEISQDNLFEGTTYTTDKFNKYFEQHKKRENKKSKGLGIVKVDLGISAFNDYDGESGGVGLDKYDNLYAEDNFNDYGNNFASIGSGMIGNKNKMMDNHDQDDANSDDSDEPDISLDSLDEDDYQDQDGEANKQKLDDAMKKLMAERESDDVKYDNLPQEEFGSALDDKYGISNQFGFMIGTDKFGHQKNIKKRDVKDDALKAYKQLTEK